MENYYFTFGQAHYNIWGEPMKDVWVRVIAEDYTTARSLFFERFCMNFLEKPNQWSMQYEAKDFNPNYFPSGEYTVIRQYNEDIQADKQH